VSFSAAFGSFFEIMLFTKHTTLSPEETHALGKAFGRSLVSGSIIAFFGDLGAGKTTFIRGLIDGIGSIDTRSVCSPTFTLLNIYHGDKMVFHFDLYRLPREEEFFAAGFDEYFKADGICCVEWAEKIASSLPIHAFKVIFSHLGETRRQIEIVKGLQ
jgi:tRNA threonylcarbamoyladenosine biosynthesis protein TsaE